MGKIRIIVAADPNGIIGLDGTMPWHYKADFKRFKNVTMGSTLIMGRLTWESLPKPLPGRRMIVVTRQTNPTSKHPAGSCEYYNSAEVALLAAGSDQHGATNGDVWIAGGADIYKLFLPNVDEIDFTQVPSVSDESIRNAKVVTKFDANLLEGFNLVSTITNEEDSRLTHQRYARLT